MGCGDVNNCFKKTFIFPLIIIFLLFCISCSQYDETSSAPAQSYTTNVTDNISSDPEQEMDEKTEPVKYDQLFQYNGLTLMLSDIKEVKQGIANEGIEMWEYDIYVVYPGATLSVISENNIDEMAVKLDYPDLRLWVGDFERIDITKDMPPVEITDSTLGIVGRDANVWVIAFELCSEGT